MVPDVAKIGHSFKGAMAYYLHDKAQAGAAHLATADRIAWTETRNLATDGPHTATRIMIATAAQADELKAAAGVKNTGRKSQAHVYAYSLAWHPDEAAQLDRAEMIRAADASLKVLGAEQHQAVIVCHDDRKHPHVHVIVNRVHPDTGKMLSTSNDRLKLSDWANEYERERGQILTPAREDKRQVREQLRQSASPAPQKPAQRERVQSEASALKELSDAQKARHKAEWPTLTEKARADRQAIYADYGARIKDAAAQHKAATRQVWAQHFREARTQSQTFAAREQSISGIIGNALAAAKHQQATGQEPHRGTLSLTFSNVLSAAARAQAFGQQQDMSRAALARELKRVLDGEISALKERRGQDLAAQRQAFAADRASLIARQDLERAKVREAWRQVYERRGKDPKYQARQNARPSPEQKPMADNKLTPETLKDLLAGLVEVSPKTRMPVSTAPKLGNEQSVSRPAPAPSPAGVPVPAQRTVQPVPKVDRAAEWAKTQQGQEALKRTAPTPKPTPAFQQSATPPEPPKPQTRAEYWAQFAKDRAKEQPTPQRDRTRDFDQER